MLSPADVTCLREFLLDLGQVFLIECDIQGAFYGFQVSDLVSGLGNKFGQSLIGPFLFVVPGKIFLCVFLRGLDRIQRDGELFSGIVIQCSQLFRTFRKLVAVCID